MKRIAYYPGCSLEGLAGEFDVSTRAVCQALGIELVEIPDWNCCGSSPAQSCDPLLSAALSGRNLALAAREGCDVVMTPCPACLKALKGANKTYANQKKRKAFLDILGMDFDGTVKPLSVVELLYEGAGVETIREKVIQPLTGVRVVPYYGCLLTRPPGLDQFDDPENPISMDRLMEATGAVVLDFPYKTECCGAAHGVVRNDLVGSLSGRILDMAERVGAQAIVVACPLCQQNLDLRQDQVSRMWKRSFDMPVLYVTQMIGAALGIDPGELGMDKVFVDPYGLFEQTAQEARPAENAGA